MDLIAGVLTGLAVALAVGFATGNPVRLDRRPARPAVSERQRWLIQAGSDLSPRQFAAGSLTLGLLTFTAVVIVTSAPAVAIVPAVAIGLLPRTWFARQRLTRLAEVQESWPDGLRDLLASIGAGMSLHQAVLTLAGSGPEPLQRAFARYPSLSRVLGTVPALEVVKEELADPTSDRVIEVLVIAHEKGGHLLGRILRDLADATTRDVRTAEELTTESLEQRINARAVFVLPWIVLLLLTARPGHFRDFYRGGGGVAVVLLGGALSLLGMWAVARLSREPVEQRVLGAGAAVSVPLGERP